MSGKNFPQRGDIYWVDLEPTRGGEIQKIRPGLIVSNDIGNEVSSVVMVAPITSKIKQVHSFEVKTTIDGKPAKIMLNQCRAVDKSRLLKKLDQIDWEVMQAVEEAIKVVFALT